MGRETFGEKKHSNSIRKNLVGTQEALLLNPSDVQLATEEQSLSANHVLALQIELYMLPLSHTHNRGDNTQAIAHTHTLVFPLFLNTSELKNRNGRFKLKMARCFYDS